MATEVDALGGRGAVAQRSQRRDGANTMPGMNANKLCKGRLYDMSQRLELPVHLIHQLVLSMMWQQDWPTTTRGNRQVCKIAGKPVNRYDFTCRQKVQLGGNS